MNFGYNAVKLLRILDLMLFICRSLEGSKLRSSSIIEPTLSAEFAFGFQPVIL